MSKRTGSDPITRAEAVNIVHVVDALNRQIRNLNRALFGTEKPEPQDEPKAGGLSGYGEFGYHFDQVGAKLEEAIEQIRQRLEDEENDG